MSSLVTINTGSCQDDAAYQRLQIISPLAFSATLFYWILTSYTAVYQEARSSGTALGRPLCPRGLWGPTAAGCLSIPATDNSHNTDVTLSIPTQNSHNTDVTLSIPTQNRYNTDVILSIPTQNFHNTDVTLSIPTQNSHNTDVTLSIPT